MRRILSVFCSIGMFAGMGTPLAFAEDELKGLLDRLLATPEIQTRVRFQRLRPGAARQAVRSGLADGPQR